MAQTIELTPLAECSCSQTVTPHGTGPIICKPHVAELMRRLNEQAVVVGEAGRETVRKVR